MTPIATSSNGVFLKKSIAEVSSEKSLRHCKKAKVEPESESRAQRHVNAQQVEAKEIAHYMADSNECHPFKAESLILLEQDWTPAKAQAVKAYYEQDLKTQKAEHG